MSAGADETTGDVAAAYLAGLDHEALAGRVAARFATEYPHARAELGDPAAVDRTVRLAALLTATTIVADVLEALEVADAIGSLDAVDPAAGTG